MDNKKILFRELTEKTATDIFLEGFSEIGETVTVGKNEIFDYYSMATSFFQAANELKNIVLANYGMYLFRYEYPMFFLYRHALELYLKSNLPNPKKGHNLEDLLSDFIKHFKDVHGVDISNGWFVEAIREFSKIDPFGQSFRYPKNLSGNSTMSSDYVINIKSWEETINNINKAFIHLHLFQMKQDKNQEITAANNA